MVDFNQGLSLGDALHGCHTLDDQGLYWFEEPITYDNLADYARLTRELKTPVQLGENSTARGRSSRPSGRVPVIAGSDADRRGHRVASCGRDRRRSGCRDVDPPLPGSGSASDARDGDRALARMVGLGQSNSHRTVPTGERLPPHPGPAGQRHRVGRGRGQALFARSLTVTAFAWESTQNAQARVDRPATPRFGLSARP